MSNEAKLKALLAEAREAMVCAECGEYVDGEVRLRERIDAALAEPVEPVIKLNEKAPVLPCWYCDGRDGDSRPYNPAVHKGWHCEACDERRLLRTAERERDEARAEVAVAYQRGAEAMREAMALAVLPSMTPVIRALPLPEEK